LPLTAGCSLAADPRLIPHGAPVLVEIDQAQLPSGAPPFPRLMLSHDEGAAITGPGRADLYLGVGDAAGAVAGRLQARGRLRLLVLKSPRSVYTAPSP
jgi:membrane-bound lytic murein transglycosylase A